MLFFLTLNPPLKDVPWFELTMMMLVHVCSVLKESGRATHLPVFIVGVFSGDKKLAEGWFGLGLKRCSQYSPADLVDV